LGKKAMAILKELPYETKNLESLCTLIVSRNN